MSQPNDREKIESVTIYEEDFYATKEITEDFFHILAFRLSQEWYGINVAKIKVINKVQPITYLPFAPVSVAGIINFRGEILSVTDLKKILGLPASELTESARLVVVEFGSCGTALLVDQIDEIVAVPVNQIYPKLETIAPQTAEYIEAGYRVGKKLLGILNVERILQRDEQL